MNKNLYSKLARDNIKKNKDTYFPYILSSIVMIALFYILYAIAGEIGDGGFAGERTIESIKLNITIKSMIATAVLFVGIFALVMIYNIIKIKRSNPIDLINEEKKGQKDPKVNWNVNDSNKTG